MLSNTLQVERAEKNLMETRKELMGQDGQTGTQKASQMMFKSFEDSLKLFIESLKHQDPMDPVDTTEMAKQMFQLSQAAGQHSMNEKLDQQLDMMRTGQVLATSSLLGKRVELSTDKFALEHDEKVDLSFELPRNMAKAKLELLDERGGVVFEKDYTPGAGRTTLEAGLQRISWAGEVNTAHGRRLNGGQPLEEGNFKIRVSVYDDKNKKILDPFTQEPLEIPTTIKAKLTGSDFSQKVPKLMIGNDMRLPLSAIVSIQEGASGTHLVDRVSELKEAITQLPELEQKQTKRNVKTISEANRKAEKKDQKFEERVNRLTPEQYEELREQLQERLTRGI